MIDLKHSLIYDPIWCTNSTCAGYRLELFDQHMCCWYTKWGHNINHHDSLLYMTPFGVPTAHVLGKDQHMCCWYTQWGHITNHHYSLLYMTPFGVLTAHVLGIDWIYVTSTCTAGTQSGVMIQTTMTLSYI